MSVVAKIIQSPASTGYSMKLYTVFSDLFCELILLHLGLYQAKFYVQNRSIDPLASPRILVDDSGLATSIDGSISTSSMLKLSVFATTAQLSHQRLKLLPSI